METAFWINCIFIRGHPLKDMINSGDEASKRPFLSHSVAKVYSSLKLRNRFDSRSFILRK